MRLIALCLALVLGLSGRATADDTLGLRAPAEVTESGLLKHLLPRFSLKTGIRVAADDAGSMGLTTAPEGVPVFQRGDTIYYLVTGGEAREVRFRDWLTSEVGARTIAQFQPSHGPAFTAPRPVAVAEVAPVFDGDVAAGEALSFTHCGRCHVIGPKNAMNSIGSTPSFALLRAMSDWDSRFQQFYVLRPHGAFTQIKDVTAPFDPARPSPIAPVTMTLDDLDAILAFVAKIEAADLGAPLQLQ